MWQHLIGARSEPVVNWIERGAVRRFAEAIGDGNPLFRDEDAARRGPFGGLIAPPTFPYTLDYGQIAGLDLPSAGLIHGEQRISALRPLRVGERITCQTIFEDCYQKQGGRGLLTFVVTGHTGTDEAGDEVVSMRRVLVITEAVLQSMSS